MDCNDGYPNNRSSKQAKGSDSSVQKLEDAENQKFK